MSTGSSTRIRPSPVFRVALLAMLVAPGLVAAQGAPPPAAPDSARAPYRYRLLLVSDDSSGAPIAGAEVSAVGAAQVAFTRENGSLPLAFLPLGGGEIRVRKLGYLPLTLPVAISPRDTAPVSITLIRDVQPLPAVVSRDQGPRYLSPALRGFEERRRSGFGQFIDDSTLRANAGAPMTRLLDGFTGATLNNGHLVSTRETSSGPVLLTHRSDFQCDVTVFRDGVRLTGSPDFRKESTEQYAGIEFYPSATTAPIWVSPTDTGCGVLFLWTRE